MLQKILMALLAVMLVILLLFNSLGISYDSNDFFGTIVTVERGLSKVSDTIITGYNKVKSIASDVKEILSPEFLAGQESWKDWIIAMRDGWFSFLDDTKRDTTFIAHYGLNPFSEDWLYKYNFFYKLRNSSLIHNSDGSIDWEAFDLLAEAHKNSTLPEQFQYLQLQYERFLNDCYKNAIKNINNEYDIFIISKEDINVKKLSSEQIYNKLIAHNNPIMAFKVPKLRVEYDEQIFGCLWSDKDFATDFMTSFRFPLISDYQFTLSDSISLDASFVTFSSSTAIPDNRIIVETPIFNLVETNTILGLTFMSPTVLSGTFDCTFIFDYSGMMINKSGYSLYKSYLEENDLSENFTTGDLAYPAHYGYVVSSDILNYDTQGIFNKWF